MIRRLRAAERAALTDFVHDGPVQELTAATLALQVPGWQRHQGELQDTLDAAVRSLRVVTDGAWAVVPPETALPEAIRQRTAWLPVESVAVDVRHTCAALRAEAPLIADVVELALFLMTADGHDGPGTRADVCVQAGDGEAEIVLTLTPDQDGGGAVGGGAGGGGWAAAADSLAGLASNLGGAAHVEGGPARFQVRITLPRRCAVGQLLPATTWATAPATALPSGCSPGWASPRVRPSGPGPWSGARPESGARPGCGPAWSRCAAGSAAPRARSSAARTPGCRSRRTAA
jgi:hypothetical protein